MKTTTHLLNSKLLLLLFFSTWLGYSQSVATYTVTFNSVWNSTDHGTLPGNAHWSRLVGANHNNTVSFVGLGQIATEGIEDVAEKGQNDEFESEVNTEIANGTTEQYIEGSSLGSATGNITLNNLQVSEDYPLLTLVSMIAPSPDWMIMVSNLELRENGQWKTAITLDLYPIDAGTDSGTSYTASNDDTDPQEPIFTIQNMYGFNDQKIGTLTVTLQEVLSVDNFNTEEATLEIFPNPVTDGFANFSTNKHRLKSITLYNVLGKQVLHQALNTTQTTLQLEALNAGIYIANISLDNNLDIRKRLIIK
jgi:hypothetical protein